MRYDWSELYAMVRACESCELHKTRTNVVIGEGNPHAAILLVGEGPGRDEDISGRPFVGAAGKLLDKMLLSVGLKRDEVYIANVVKCRPPQNRTPFHEEAKSCLPHLRAQFALLQPKIVVCMGATAAKYVYDEQVRITRDRGVWKQKMGVWFLPTYHPAALLRDESKKAGAWEDMKKIRAKLDILDKNG